MKLTKVKISVGNHLVMKLSFEMSKIPSIVDTLSKEEFLYLHLGNKIS